MTVHHRACPLCEAMCGLEITTELDRVVSIRGDHEDPLSKGYMCPKGYALKDLHEDPDRLRAPLRRRGRDFEEVGWDEAIAEAGERLGRMRREHGERAVGVYTGNPSVHGIGAGMGALSLLATLRTKSRFSATSLDQGPKQLACMWMYGNQALVPIPDIDRCQYLLILGANPLVSNGSLMTAPGMRHRLTALRDRGGSFVVIDPRRTETAEAASRHLFIRPGTDALFLASIVHTLVAEQWARPGRLDAFIEGRTALENAVTGLEPERTAVATGIAPDEVRRIARELAESTAAACYGRVGTCTQRFGTVTSWLCDVVNILTGNLDRPGGVMFTTPAVDLASLARRTHLTGHQGVWKSRVRGAPESLGELPAATLAEEIVTPGDDRIRALVTIAGNPVLSSPGGQALRRALSGLELMVSIDPYLNETTRHAHYVFPPTSALESWNYDLVFHTFAVRNTARVSPAVFEPPAGALDDHSILCRLARAIRGAMGPVARESSVAAAGEMEPQAAVDLLLRTGPHGEDSPAPRSAARLSLARLTESPHGIDLGPLEPRLPEALATADGKIHLAPKPLLDDLTRVRATLEESAPALSLIGRRELRSNNSWMHNAPSLMKGPSRCTLLMNPDDIRARGLASGQLVVLESHAGTVTAMLESSDQMMPGVVSLPHGYGHDDPETRLGVAREHAGVSINDVTDPAVLDQLSGCAVLSGVPVQVRAIRPQE